MGPLGVHQGEKRDNSEQKVVNTFKLISVNFEMFVQDKLILVPMVLDMEEFICFSCLLEALYLK